MAHNRDREGKRELPWRRAGVVLLLTFLGAGLLNAFGQRPRTELSTLEPFDLILLIVLGDLVQQGVTQNDFSVTGAMLASGTIAMMALLFSWLAFRFHGLQPILEGDPVILVERGTPIEKNLRSNRITLEELAAQARMQQVAFIEDIEWAVLETSGSISVIPKRSGR